MNLILLSIFIDTTLKLSLSNTFLELKLSSTVSAITLSSFNSLNAMSNNFKIASLQ